MSKLLEAFNIIHGELKGSCYPEIEEDDITGEEIAVHVMKDGNLAWTATREQIAFELSLRTYKKVQMINDDYDLGK